MRKGYLFVLVFSCKLSGSDLFGPGNLLDMNYALKRENHLPSIFKDTLSYVKKKYPENHLRILLNWKKYNSSKDRSDLSDEDKAMVFDARDFYMKEFKKAVGFADSCLNLG